MTEKEKSQNILKSWIQPCIYEKCGCRRTDAPAPVCFQTHSYFMFPPFQRNQTLTQSVWSRRVLRKPWRTSSATESLVSALASSTTSRQGFVFSLLFQSVYYKRFSKWFSSWIMPRTEWRFNSSFSLTACHFRLQPSVVSFNGDFSLNCHFMLMWV